MSLCSALPFAASLLSTVTAASPFLSTTTFSGNLHPSQVAVAHACNPTYLRGRDQEDHSLNPARENSLRDPVLKKHITKKGQWSDSSGRTLAYQL
jgi:hypothetical protein